MGEIGISRDEFLVDLRWWEVRSIMRGYNRRTCLEWSRVRWETFNIMAAFIGGEGMKKSGLFSPKDLLPLPTDDGKIIPLSDAERKALQQDIDSFNWQPKQDESKKS